MLSLLTTTALLGSGTIAAELLGIKLKTKDNKMANAGIKEKEELENLLGKGLTIAKDIELSQKSSFEGVNIIGPTGSGKTTSFFFPNLLSNKLKGSIVVTDPKGELYEKTSYFQKKVCKRNVILFAPLQPDVSEKYNPLEQCKDTTDVMQLANLLLINGSLATEIATGKKAGGVEWVDMATPLFTAALLYCKEKGYPIDTIEDAFKLIINTDAEELDTLFSNASEDVQLQYNIFKSVGESERTMGSIKITLATNLKLFTDKKICTVTKYSHFKAEDLRNKSTCIYIMYPERRSNYVAPFMACFFTQLIEQALESYTNKALPITFFFDEFANVGMLNNMSANAATVRSRKISLNICLQSITQLKQLYGKDNAMSILNNLKTKIILPGLNDLDTLEYVSKLCGKTEINISSKSVTDHKTTKTYNKTTKQLMDLDEIRCLHEDKLLLILHNKQPVIANKNAYYTNNIYTNNIKETFVKQPKINLKEDIKDIKLEIKYKELLGEYNSLLTLQKTKEEKEKNLREKANKIMKEKSNVISELFG
ncbi:type IV secretory system conjugative DNA transfer family protein [Clostridium botulinum]|uniref:type IV secretory system conjugative DNA transfer family protein n=1 Tax=Clostridium botulinum TaxID=1491 RepID=UPI003EF92A75